MKARVIIYSVLFLLGILRFSIAGVFFPDLGFGEKLVSAFVGVIFLGTTWEVIAMVNRVLNRYLPYEKTLWLRLSTQVVSSMLFAVLFSYCMSLIFLPYLPIEIDSFLAVASYSGVSILTVAINLGYFGSYFFKKWKRTLIRTERLAKENAEMERNWAAVQYHNLQNQLNPHFFFNSITSLQGLIQENQELAGQFLQQLSHVYRYILQNREKELVTIKEELQFLEQYLFLLRTRFGEAFQVELDIPEGTTEQKVIPVSLQALVENAIKHNILNTAQPLSLDIRVDGQFLTVSNTFQPKRIIESSNRIGLKNLKQLYAYLTDQPMEFGQSDGRFIVKLPLLQ